MNLKPLLLLIFFLPGIGYANNNPKGTGIGKKRIPKNTYSYPTRQHTVGETMKYIGWMYGLTWAVYPLTQWNTVRDEGSWKKYRHNFGKMVFDQDEPFWNWLVHPLSGSQLFLYYRALGYTRPHALGLTFISSALFEFTVETYTEPASVQDFYQTPVLGSLLGVGIETLSLYLLNTGNAFGKFFGHIINPFSLFWFYEGKVQVFPTVHKFRGKNVGGLSIMASF